MIDATAEERLYDAAWDGEGAEVASLLRNNPGLDVNWANKELITAVHVTCMNGHAEVVKMLLAHSCINVNLKTIAGYTPVGYACAIGRVAVVQVLLHDPRVDVTLDDTWGRTPLWYASCNGRHEVIEWLIASGRDLGDFKNKTGKSLQKHYTALEAARNAMQYPVVLLLEQFMTNPMQTRHELRVKLGVLNALAEVFALTVFLCDDLLELKPASHLAATPHPTTTAATRFFAIAKRLPMELQMMLCRRVVGSTKQNILRKDSEVAFKSLARILPLGLESLRSFHSSRGRLILFSFPTSSFFFFSLNFIFFSFHQSKSFEF